MELETEINGKTGEREASSYYQAAVFSLKGMSNAAYHAIGMTIYFDAPQIHLSVFKASDRTLQLPWVVAVIGERPDEKIQQAFRNIFSMSGGIPTVLPKNLLSKFERSHQQELQRKQQTGI